MFWKLSSSRSSGQQTSASVEASAERPGNELAAASTDPSGSPGQISGEHADAGPSISRYERMLRDEERYQAKQYPSYEEVPGCMQLLDEFLSCYALFPQLRSFYRYADFRDCSYKFADFKYCLSLKSESEDRRRELWTKRRAEWWAKRRYEGSSEDVWDVRDKPLDNFPKVWTEEDEAKNHTDQVVT